MVEHSPISMKTRHLDEHNRIFKYKGNTGSVVEGRLAVHLMKMQICPISRNWLMHGRGVGQKVSAKNEIFPSAETLTEWQWRGRVFCAACACAWSPLL